MSIDGNRYSRSNQVFLGFTETGNSGLPGLQSIHITLRSNGDHVVVQAGCQRVIDGITQVLPQDEDQADGEDADEQGQQRGGGTCALASNVAQCYLGG